MLVENIQTDYISNIPTTQSKNIADLRLDRGRFLCMIEFQKNMLLGIHIFLFGSIMLFN